MKVGRKILVIVLSIVMLVAILYYDAYYIAPSRYSVRYETISSKAIPEQLDDVSILFFSDLDYNRFVNEERLNKLIDKINSLSPDIVLFGGDVFDQDALKVSDQAIKTVTKAFESIHAPLGKFAVLGDFDHMNEETEKNVKKILYDSNFELLNNQSVFLRNNGSESITLVGIDSGLLGKPDIVNAYSNVSHDTYTITLCHTPDLADDVPADITNYFLAGHSHGGQVYWGFGALYQPKMAETYFNGKHKIHSRFTLDITNGVGTTIQDVRFLANAELVVYRLDHKQ